MDRPIFISWAFVAFALSPWAVVANVPKQVGKATLTDANVRPALEAVAEQGELEIRERGVKVQAEDTPRTVGALPRGLTAATPVPTCTFTKSSETLNVSLDPYSLDAKFDCGLSAQSNTVVPDCASETKTCCDSTGNNCTTSISDVVGVDGSASKGKDSVITVKLDDTPGKNGKLCYKCTKDSTKTCLVTVSMPAPLQDNQCNFGKTVELSPISTAEGEARFECKGPVKDKPTAEKVYKSDDCTGEASNLQDLVPGAKLVGDEKGGVYTLKVAALPTKTQKLCFQCVYPDPRKDKRREEITSPCNVTVTVKGAGSDPSKTTTASTTASAVRGVAVTWLAVLAFVLVTVGSVCHSNSELLGFVI